MGEKGAGVSFVGEVWEFLADPELWSGPAGIPARVGEHLTLSLVSVVAAALVSLPLAVWLGHIRKGTVLAVGVVNIGRAVPSFGILVLAVILAVEMGIGFLGAWPTFIALFALAAPPIFTNAVAGVEGVEPEVVEAARGMGLAERQVLTRVELPLASPLILEGVRVALLQVIATATLAALVAWGGLGRFIIDGLAQRDNAEVFVGALLVGLLAVLAELAFTWGEKRLLRRLGLSPTGGPAAATRLPAGAGIRP